jgi:hypothetical protein
MFHGAQSDNDVTFLFITNKPFDIHFTHIKGERSKGAESSRARRIDEKGNPGDCQG